MTEKDIIYRCERAGIKAIVTSGDDEILDQIEKQVAKLVDVVDVKVLEPDSSVYRELVLIKVRANHENRRNIIEISNLFRTRIIDTSPDSLIIELTGETGKIDAFITMLGDFEILEIARTGITGLGRGIANVTYLD